MCLCPADKCSVIHATVTERKRSRSGLGVRTESWEEGLEVEKGSEMQLRCKID